MSSMRRNAAIISGVRDVSTMAGKCQYIATIARDDDVLGGVGDTLNFAVIVGDDLGRAVIVNCLDNILMRVDRKKEFKRGLRAKKCPFSPQSLLLATRSYVYSSSIESFLKE